VEYVVYSIVKNVERCNQIKLAQDGLI